MFQKLEYGEISISEEFHNTEDQIHLLQLIGFFEFIAKLEKLDLVKFEDINEIFGYYIVRVYENPSVEEYRTFLKEWATSRGYPLDITFPNFETLAKRLSAPSASKSR